MKQKNVIVSGGSFPESSNINDYDISNKRRHHVCRRQSGAKILDIYNEPEVITLDSKTIRRYKKYRNDCLRNKRAKHKRCFNGFDGFNFVYNNKSVELIGFEFNDLGVYWYIPKLYLKAQYCCELNKYILPHEFKEGQTLIPDEDLSSLFPSMFKRNKRYEITNKILTIYYSFESKKDLLNLTKYILFDQTKMIYRKKYERQRNKNN